MPKKTAKITKTMKLGVTRTINPSVFLYKKQYYVKTREIAWLLEIKQPFEFVKTLKEMYGDEVILKGLETESFRDATDNSRTTFVDIETLMDYLERPDARWFHHVNEKKLVQTIEAIENLL